MIEPSTKFQKVTHQVSCQINDEVAILDLKRSLYFGLEGTGVQIWEALEQPRSLAELCDVVEKGFEVSSADCQADVAQLLSALTEEGLLEVVN